jgi:hypothetical protein
VFRIRDVLIRGSGSLTYQISSVVSRRQQKKWFFSKMLCLLPTVGTFTSVFKDNKSDIVKIMGFLNYFACLWKDPDPEPDPNPD